MRALRCRHVWYCYSWRNQYAGIGGATDDRTIDARNAGVDGGQLWLRNCLVGMGISSYAWYNKYINKLRR